MKASKDDYGPRNVPVTFYLEDPEGLVDDNATREHYLKGAVGQSLLELALENDIGIEHACGGVCACSTCHVHVDAGEEAFDEPEDDELDRVEEAPGNDRKSRLSCQCRLLPAAGPDGEDAGLAIRVRVPAWNRNAVKEVPH